MTMLQNNNPLLELTDDNDLFGTLEKAKTITSFVESYMHCFCEGEHNKIIALYGPWGCGKTSLMHFLEKKIEPPVSIFFETWKYEKDGNLALSLLDAIAEKAEYYASRETVKAILKTGANLLVSAAKSLSFNAGPLSFSGDTFISNIESSIDKNNSILSFHKRKTEFETQYQKIEDEILKGQAEDAKLIVYIDDLDRCEPENVLSLMVALKHFFSLGKRTIFFCGIDKEAIGQAIKTKYQDIIQPDEYLEKIVDVSFSMPRTFDLRKFVALHFDEQHVDLITKFFTEIGFTNARKLKKVMNKYLLLKHIKENELHGHELILIQDNPLSISFTVFFIILYEFDNLNYQEVKNMDERKQDFLTKHYKYCDHNEINSKRKQFDEIIEQAFPYLNAPLHYLVSSSVEQKLINTFITKPKLEEIGFDLEIKKYILQFIDINKTIPVGFAQFISNNLDTLKQNINKKDNNYKYCSLFDMVETLL